MTDIGHLNNKTCNEMHKMFQTESSFRICSISKHHFGKPCKDMSINDLNENQTLKLIDETITIKNRNNACVFQVSALIQLLDVFMI